MRMRNTTKVLKVSLPHIYRFKYAPAGTYINFAYTHFLENLNSAHMNEKHTHILYSYNISEHF